MSKAVGSGVAIGVDGGAGSLKFVVRKPDGGIVHYECAGANQNLVGMDEFLSRLSQGIHDALGRAACLPEQVSSAGFALSGVDRPAEVAALREAIPTRVLPKLERLWVGNDALAALRQGSGALRGLVLIAGTGSICFAVASNGRSGRVGGWGGELGDEGSGFWIGHRGLQSACRMADGRLTKTRLLDQILNQLGLATPQDMIPWVAACSREEFKQKTAALFPIIAEQALEGDHSAKQAIMLGIGHLVQHVLTAEKILRQLEKKPPESIAESATVSLEAETIHDAELAAEASSEDRVKLVCAGGLFARDKKFYDAFVFQLTRARDVFLPSRLTEPAALGALALGEESASV